MIVIHVALAWLSRSPVISWGEDDAMYVLLAGELQHGRYAESWSVDAPTHARYPPGFPAILTATKLVTGGSLGAYAVVVLLCSAASLALFFLVVQRHFGDALALFVTGLMATNALAVSEAGIIMAEAPFRLWLSLTLWSASRKDPRTRDLVIAGSAAVLAALTRTIGVAIIAGLALHWILERRWKAVAALFVGALPVGLWSVWTVVAPEADSRLLYVHMILNSGDPPSAVDFRLLRVRRALFGIVEYARTLVPTALSFFGLKNNPIDNLAWLILAVVTIPPGLLVTWRRWRLLVLLVMSYAAILLVWPWQVERFVSPVSATLLVLIGAGVLHIVRRWPVRVQRAALAGVASLFVVGAVQLSLPTWRRMLACDRMNVLDSPTCLTEDRRGLSRLANYVREHTPTNAVFFVPKEAAFFLHSGRQSIRRTGLDVLPPDSLGPMLRRTGVSYAVVSPIGEGADVFGKLIADACRDFQNVAAFEGDALLLRVRETRIAHDDETCKLLAGWKDGIPARWRVVRRESF